MTFREGGAQSVRRSRGRAVAVIVLAVAAIYSAYEWGRPWLANRLGDADGPSPDAAITAGSTASRSATEAASEEVDSLVAARAADVESELRARMERDLEAMRQKVEAAKRAAASEPRGDASSPVPARSERADDREPDGRRAASPPPRRLIDRSADRRNRVDEDRPRALRPGPEPVSRSAPRLASRIAPGPTPRPVPRIGSSLTRQSSPPRRLNSPSARYPLGVGSSTRAERLVPVRVWIDEQGRVTSAALRRPTNSAFDEPALRTAQETRFVPAMANGMAVTSSVTLLVHFRQ